MRNETDKPATMTLTDVPVGGAARVTRVNDAGRTGKRLMEMGVLPGVSLRVVRTAPFGDPIEVRLRGYSLAMRRSEAGVIEVAV